VTTRLFLYIRNTLWIAPGSVRGEMRDDEPDGAGP